ncbi:MAG: 16S rRNA processing protein RimM [Desulfobacteraceae bacterium]|nr:16S rRNA processing protein RimM [Desulfobacteraceae bacterium]MBC2754664.1 16S rRNA processing protein RimM [Desulfobacteraceae bacterium]
MDRDDTLLIGKIVGVHGMKGYLKVYSFDESMDLFDPGRRIRFKSSSGAMNTFTVKDVQAYKNFLRVAFEEISDRTAAEALIGSEMLLKRSELPEPEEGSWYWCDLIGLAVYGIDGTYLGCVENLFETGSNDVLVVKRGEEEILIPVTASIVCDVDFKEQKINVDLPEGLL